MRNVFFGAVMASSLVVGCGSDTAHGGNQLVADSGAGAGESFVVTGGPFSLQPGEEKYMCYTATIDHDVTFHSFWIDQYPNVHHMLFARALAPEPEGPHECPVLFKPTWLPLFTTGKGGTRLDLPEGSGFDLQQGTQLVMQLHLLNTTSAPATGTVQVHAKAMDPAEEKYHAALYPFGTTVFDLPPNQSSTVTHECVMDKDMDAFVAFPHMHLLGKELAFQVGKDAASLTDVFRAPYDFNNQQLVPVSFSLHAGDFTRTTCRYENTTSRHVSYGESTHQEMCFFAIFIKDGQALDGNCVDISGLGKSTSDAGPPNGAPDAGVDAARP
jgi:hypothetical protein